MQPDERARFEADKQANTLQLLFKCARLVNERAMARVNAEAGRAVFRQAIANLLPHIALEGTRATELAARAGVSKQAVSKTLAELVAQGTVELADDPSDGRAKLVRFTPAGLAAIRHGLGVLTALERDLAAHTGPGRMRQLHRALEAVLAALPALDAKATR